MCVCVSLSIYTYVHMYFSKFELFDLILLLKLDKQFPVEQFEATVSQSTVPSPLFTSTMRRFRVRAVYAHVCIYVCVYIYIYIYICMYLSLSLYIYIYIYNIHMQVSVCCFSHSADGALLLGLMSCLSQL